MQTNKYEDFSAIDFLKDEDFLKWQLFREEAGNAYWAAIMAHYPGLAAPVERAIELYKKCVKWNDFKLAPYEIIERLALLQNSIRKRKRVQFRRRVYSWTAAAACVALALALPFTFHANSQAGQPAATGSLLPDVAPREIDEVTLVVDNSAMILSNNSQISYMASGAIIVNTDNNTGDPLIREHIAQTQQNKLIVPKGRRSSIILSDNSRIWLNSGTTLIYPSSFEDDKREIYVDGEIYIEVEKDARRPFHVKSSRLNIEVLGTKFNVSAYSSDAEQLVTLVEGSIAITSSGKKNILQPNQLLTASNNGDCRVNDVSVMDYICWRYGWIQAHTTSLKELAKRLSRYYDKEIICDPQVNMLKCSGKLVLFDDLEKVLYTISKNMNINYQYTDEHIVLSPKK
jgi:ferric-dicitrate binding protein FerR (iron transport regulator)